MIWNSLIGFLWIILAFLAGFLTRMIIDRMKENENADIKKKK